MDISADQLVPLLFKLLIAFVVINIGINLFLLYTKPLRIYKLLALFWPSVLFVFIMQALFQTGTLEVLLAYSASFLSLTIYSVIGFQVLKKKFPFKKYLLLYLGLYPLTYLLYRSGFGFTTVAIPFATGTAAPLLHTFYLLCISERKKTTRLQKLLGFSYLYAAIHCVNYAIFRMEPGAQLWGWIMTYAGYDSLAVILPSIALEEANLTENDRLQNLVDERTQELNRSLQENENLLKVVLHDISSPLMSMKFYLSYLKSGSLNEDFIKKAIKSQAALEKIIIETKNRYSKRNDKERSRLHPIEIEKCLNDVRLIFGPKLEKKNISLIFNNQLSPDAKILADETSFTHSVLSNLISNGLKFSYPDSVIEVLAREHNNNIILEVNDQGPGIPEEIILNLMNNVEHETTLGTNGEEGTGYGLSIVKSFIDSYGGQIEFISRPKETFPQTHGTKIIITFDRA